MDRLAPSVPPRVRVGPEAPEPARALCDHDVHLRQPDGSGAGGPPHARGLSAELGATFIRHFTIEKLDRAIADLISAYLELDLAKVWGDARSVAADGTQVDTLLDNLLAERHIRYGGYGGIAYHHVADNYIALFSHFIPCGVWEAVYIIEGLLKQRSDADPDTIHADTQGQSYPVHDDLDPRRPPLLDPVATPALHRVAAQQRVQGVPGARSGGPHNHPAAYLAEPELRAQIDAATNKIESYNNAVQLTAAPQTATLPRYTRGAPRCRVWCGGSRRRHGSGHRISVAAVSIQLYGSPRMCADSLGTATGIPSEEPPRMAPQHGRPGTPRPPFVTLQDSAVQQAGDPVCARKRVHRSGGSISIDLGC